MRESPTPPAISPSSRPGWGLAVSTLCLAAAAGCSSPSAPATQRFESTRDEMGLPFRIVLYAVDSDTATRAATAAFDEIHRLNGLFSDYDYDSELSALNRTAGGGRAVRVSPELWTILVEAREWSARTDGAFDVTVGPYVNLWRRARREKALPRPDLLQRAAEAVGYRKMVLNPRDRTVELTVPNMRLDLGGIAKGYAVDAALRVLKTQGIRSALVSGGGDLAVSDPPPGRTGWRVTLAPVDAPGASPPPARHLLLSRCALATSGDMFQYVEIDGRRYSHVVDPRTGIGLTNHSLVHVIAPRGSIADPLSKGVSILGPVQGLAVARQIRGVQAQLIEQVNGRIEEVQTRGFARFYDRSPVPGE